MWVSHLLIAIVHCLTAVFYNSELYLVAFSFMVSMVGLYNLGCGCVVWIYIGEICEDKSMSFVNFGNFIINIFMAFSVSYMIDSALGVEWTFAIYSILNFLSSLFCLLLLKETKGKSH